VKSILIANRGEIARRVIRTARAMGLRCVAVYVDADADSPHVRDADLAVSLDTGYLDGAAIVSSARSAGADAIHPGYGFLSENATFAQQVLDAGLMWVGPPPQAISAMGDKIAAKQAAIAAGVPTLPSTESADGIGAIGYPILVKAAAGGGGKGMRVVERADDLAEAVASAQREAAAGFGDDRVFYERYVGAARHVEIQILGDRHGNLVHFGERECSIQRRHQKLIEESPSPAVDPAMRAAMGDAALALAHAIGYESAGTVEFLVDDATREFYFLEVNARLQVEHPVTEEVTGIDLVREQLRIAAGEPLGYGQDAVTFAGHAIEARLCAEDPANGFLPATGRLYAYSPGDEPAIRWESGVEQGSVVGVSFDPMLAKAIAHAPTRAEAARRLARALESLHIGGVATNRDFLASVLRHDQFVAGATTTDFIERVEPPRALVLSDEERAHVLAAAALWVQARNRRAATSWKDAPSGWRNARLPAERIELAIGDTAVTVEYRAQRDGSFVVGGVPARVHGIDAQGIDVAYAGIRRRARVTESHDGARLAVQRDRGTVEFTVVPRFVVPGSDAVVGGLNAPMPGAITEVRVAVGDEVEAGAILVVMEAMKMEHRIVAPATGIVTDVFVRAGQQVDNGEVLLIIEEQEVE
jgi:propionyl-CoA carboxylase alpha chain